MYVVRGAKRDRTANLMVANHALSQLSYSPVIQARAIPRHQWAWVELNYRPHAYQACALTT